MISLYFGLPGCGKSSFITWKIFDILCMMDRGKSPYKRIFTTCDVNIPDDRVLLMQYDWLFKYDLGADSLIILDEAQIYLFSRNFKSFTIDHLSIYSQHRRYEYDIILVTQRWDGLDVSVRALTSDVNYIVKSKMFPMFSHIYPVGYGIHVPRKKDEESKHYGEIIQGYYRWHWFDRLFHTRFLRTPFYGFYDSFCRPPLPPLPDREIELAQSVIIPLQRIPVTLKEKIISWWSKFRRGIRRQRRKDTGA